MKNTFQNKTAFHQITIIKNMFQMYNLSILLLIYRYKNKEDLEKIYTVKT